MADTVLAPEPLAAAAGFTTVTASKVTDSSGNLITNATAYFQPCDMNGNWLAYNVNNSGQSMWESVSTQVVNGAFTVVLADTKLTSPQNIYFQVRIYDNVSNADLLGPNYFIQPTGATWNFDNFIPNIATLPLVVGTLITDIWIVGTSAQPGARTLLLTHLPATPTLIGLYYNGTLQVPGLHYTLSGQIITLTFDTSSGDNVVASYVTIGGGFGNPDDGIDPNLFVQKAGDTMTGALTALSVKAKLTDAANATGAASQVPTAQGDGTWKWVAALTPLQISQMAAVGTPTTTTQGAPSPITGTVPTTGRTAFSATPASQTGVLTGFQTYSTQAGPATIVVAQLNSDSTVTLLQSANVTVAVGLNTFTNLNLNITAGQLVGIYAATTAYTYLVGGPGIYFTVGLPGTSTPTTTGVNYTVQFNWTILPTILPRLATDEAQIAANTSAIAGMRSLPSDAVVSGSDVTLKGYLRDAQWPELQAAYAYDFLTDKFIEASGSVSPSIYCRYANFASGTSYTVRVIAKAAERKFLNVYDNSMALFNTVFDVSGGTVFSKIAGNTTSIVAIGQGWYICTVTVAATATGGSNLQIRMSIDGTSFTYTGDGASGLYVASVDFTQAGSTAGLFSSRLLSDASWTKQGSSTSQFSLTGSPLGPSIDALNSSMYGYTPVKATEASGASVSPSIYKLASLVTGDTYRFWALAMKAERKILQIYCNAAGTTISATYDLSIGTASGAGSKITNQGGGVFLCELNWTATVTTSQNLQFRVFADTGGLPRVGDGVSGLYLGGLGYDHNGAAVINSQPTDILSATWSKQNITVALATGVAFGSVQSRLAALESGSGVAPIPPLQGKKWAAMGSSITAQTNYTTPLQSYSGMTLTNLGVSGAALGLDARSSPHYGSGQIYAEIPSIPANTDIVTLESGPNDFADSASAVPLGKLGDTTTSTYYGALYAAAVAIKAQAPSSKLVFINAYGSDPTSMPAYSASHTNVNGNTLAQFQQAVIDVAHYLGFPSIDVGRNAGIGLLTAAAITVDGLHINATGGVLHAKYDYQRLLEMFNAGYFG